MSNETRLFGSVTVTIEPNDKYNEVIRGEHPSDEVPETEEEYIEESNHHEASEAYLETIHGSPTTEDLIAAEEDGDDVVAECPHCSRSWRMEVRFGEVEQAKSDVESRVEAHLPCREGQALSWDDFSVSSDPDLVKKMATYFDGVDATEPTELIRAKLRLLDCEVYANVQIAARSELREQ